MTTRPRSGWSRLLLGVPAAVVVLGLAFVLAAAVRGVRFEAPAPPRGSPADPAGNAPDWAETLRLATPATPWLKLPPSAVITRIGFGSCLDQRQPQPIWDAVTAARPELFLMIGDNVYGDIGSGGVRDLAEAYRRQLAHPEFAAARARLPMLGTWDDHDYGRNDGGAAFEHRAASTELFRAYWQRGPSVAGRAGVHDAHSFGPAGRRVQVILLDTRSFRAPFAPKTAGSGLAGKYGPDSDPAKSMLGEAQWAWLEAELRKPAEIRLVVSSIQVLSEGHAYERWGHLPAELARLKATIRSAGAKGVILLSGDRHAGAIYRAPLAAGQDLIEITSSSLNRSYGPAKDVRTAELVGGLHHAENFGLVEFDWVSRNLRLSLRGIGGDELDGVTVGFSTLGLPE